MLPSSQASRRKIDAPIAMSLPTSIISIVDSSMWIVLGAALGAGGGYLNFASPDETITGGGLYLSLGTGIDAGRADVFYRGLGGRKSYINPATGQVDISQLTSDILNGYGSEINLDHSFALGDATLRAFRVDAANAAETLALAYNASSTSRPCSC